MLSLCSTLQAALAVGRRAIYNLNSSEQSILWAVYTGSIRCAENQYIWCLPLQIFSPTRPPSLYPQYPSGSGGTGNLDFVDLEEPGLRELLGSYSTVIVSSVV